MSEGNYPELSFLVKTVGNHSDSSCAFSGCVISNQSYNHTRLYGLSFVTCQGKKYIYLHGESFIQIAKGSCVTSRLHRKSKCYDLYDGICCIQVGCCSTTRYYTHSMYEFTLSSLTELLNLCLTIQMGLLLVCNGLYFLENSTCEIPLLLKKQVIASGHIVMYP